MFKKTSKQTHKSKNGEGSKTVRKYLQTKN